MIKVFVPMSDAILGDNGEICPSLIPFDLSMLARREELGDDKKPNNWLQAPETEYAQKRLFRASA